MARKRTNIEKIVGDLLIKEDLKFRREYRFDNYPVDFYLPKYNLSIQVDGSFHHGGCKLCYKGEVLLPRQVFQKRRDLACISYHKHNHINILRICECIILSDLEKVKQMVYNSINKILAGESVS